MRPTLPKRVDTGFDDIRRCVEIGLADFQVDDILALLLERAGAVEDFKGGFSAEARHATGET